MLAVPCLLYGNLLFRANFNSELFHVKQSEHVLLLILRNKDLLAAKQHGDDLRAERNRVSKQIGALMREGKKEDAEACKQRVKDVDKELETLEVEENNMQEEIRKRMLVIPQIIDPSVPIGKDDSENVELQKFGEPVVPDFEIPYHTDIMESLDGLDLDSARETTGNGFYYLMGDVARLHSSILSYARDFMINEGFTYFVPPFMIHGICSMSRALGSIVPSYAPTTMSSILMKASPANRKPRKNSSMSISTR